MAFEKTDPKALRNHGLTNGFAVDSAVDSILFGTGNLRGLGISKGQKKLQPKVVTRPIEIRGFLMSPLPKTNISNIASKNTVDGWKTISFLLPRPPFMGCSYVNFREGKSPSWEAHLKYMAHSKTPLLPHIFRCIITCQMPKEGNINLYWSYIKLCRISLHHKLSIKIYTYIK